MVKVTSSTAIMTRLFSNFPPSTKADWNLLMQKEIKGSSVQARKWNGHNIDTLPPYLTAEDLDIEDLEACQSCQKKEPGFLNISEINGGEPKLANSKIKSSVLNGANGVFVKLDQSAAYGRSDFITLLDGIRISETPIFFETNQDLKNLFEWITNGTGYHIKGGIANDPIANWMRNGIRFETKLTEITELLHRTNHLRDFYTYMIEGHVYHNAGANSVQELAFLVSAMVNYIDILTDAGIAPIVAIRQLFFSISIGTEFLTEISKLRALRFLYRKVCRAYGVTDEHCEPFIHTTTSSFLNTTALPHNNIIRSTSQAMSAIIGGCDALTVKPYNHTFQRTDDFSDRIAGNTPLILAHESHFNKVADPAGGAYFIENLTLEMADAAWKLFLELEENGGIVKCFESGYIQELIENEWNKKVESVNSQNRIVVGVNKYKGLDPNGSDDNLLHSERFERLNLNVKPLPVRNLATSVVQAL